MDRDARWPLHVTVPLGPDLTSAVERLRETIAERPSIEVGTDPRRDRCLVGAVRGTEIDLEVRDGHLWTRRVGWNVAFHGTIGGGAGGVTLEGTVGKAYHGRRDLIIPLLGVIGALVALMAVGIAVRDAATGATSSLRDLLFGLTIAAASILGAIRLRADIDRAARDDARLLVSFLARLFS